MPQFAATISEVVRLSAYLAGAYLTVALVMLMAQAHLATVAGQPPFIANVSERVILIIVSFAVAISAGSMGSEIARMVAGLPASDANSAMLLWQVLAGVVVKTIVLSVGASLAVGVATGAFSAQLAVLLGQPRAASSIWTRLTLTVLTAVVTLASVTLADAILRAVL